MLGKLSGWCLGVSFAALALALSACGGTMRRNSDESNPNWGKPGKQPDAGDPGVGAALNGEGGKVGTGGNSSTSGTSFGGKLGFGASGPQAEGGEVAAGGAGAGGPQGNASPMLPSSGCGLALPAEQVPTIPGSRTGYTEFMVDATGATLGSDEPTNAGPRQFFVRVPADYDPAQPYRVVYIGSGCGATRAGKTNTYPLFDEARGGSEQAVYVALSVPDNAANPGCYDNNTGPQSQEWETFELIHSFVESHYCVDNNRIYVAGYSTGAWLSMMWGCYFGGTPTPPLDYPDLMAGRTERKFAPRWAIRGSLAVAGSLPPNQPTPCNGPAAHLWIHDALDHSSLIATSIAGLELSLKTNGCVGNYQDGPKQPWAPAEDIPALAGGICQEYTGCPVDNAQQYPLVFCTTSGEGHTDQAPTAVAAFNAFAKLMDPAP